MPSYLPIRVGSDFLAISVAGSSSAAPPPGSLPASFADMTTASTGVRMLVPLYGGSPTHYLVLTNGVWSNPAVWSTGTVPTSSSDVQIQAGATVTVTDLAAVARSITVQGELHICCGPGLIGPCVNSRLTCTTLSVLAGGMFCIGTVADPIEDGVTAELVFASSAVDTTFDPEQWGHGLLVTGMDAMPGMLRMCGSSRLPTWVRLGGEAFAGNTTLTLGTSVLGAWKVGDTIDLPDSRQLDFGEHNVGWPNVPHWEQRTITAISLDGLTITLNSALTYDHLGGRKSDGTWDAQPLYPHVANTTRNVIVRSANPAGVRGHGLFTMRADADIRHAEFRDLGRTLNAVLNSTVFPGGDPTLTPTSIGTNQIGRYPIHFHHCWGPSAGQSNGLPVSSPRLNQGTVYGCAVTNPSQRVVGGMTTADAISKWGITQHDSSWLYNAFNVVTDYAGSAITEEQGSETENIVEYNYMTRCYGTGNRDDFGRDGDVYWARGASNRVRHNVASNYGPQDFSYGYTFFMRYLGDIQIPLIQGADLSLAADDVNSTVINGNTRGFLEFVDNEAYGGVSGLAHWWIGSFQEILEGNAGTVQDLTVWHYLFHGIFGYESNNLVIDHLVTRGDRQPGRISPSLTGFWFSDYIQQDNVLRNCDISGAQLAILNMPDRVIGTFTIEDSTFVVDQGIVINPPVLADGGATAYASRTFLIDNVTVAIIAGSPGPALDMTYLDQQNDLTPTNVMAPTNTIVRKWQGVAGHDFFAYYAPHVVSGRADIAGNSLALSAQAPTFIPSPRSGTYIGSPSAGKTNQFLHDNYLPYLYSPGIPPATGYVATLKPGGANPATDGMCVSGALLPAGATNATYTDVRGFTASPAATRYTIECPGSLAGSVGQPRTVVVALNGFTAGPVTVTLSATHGTLGTTTLTFTPSGPPTLTTTFTPTSTGTGVISATNGGGLANPANVSVLIS